LKALRDALKEQLDLIDKVPVLDVATLAKSQTTDQPAATKDGDGPRPPHYSPPVDRAVARMLADTDLNALAEMQPGDRIVFSTNPTRMQRGLPSSAGNAIETFITEQNAFISRLGQAWIERDELRTTKGLVPTAPRTAH